MNGTVMSEKVPAITKQRSNTRPKACNAALKLMKVGQLRDLSGITGMNTFLSRTPVGLDVQKLGVCPSELLHRYCGEYGDPVSVGGIDLHRNLIRSRSSRRIVDCVIRWLRRAVNHEAVRAIGVGRVSRPCVGAVQSLRHRWPQDPPGNRLLSCISAYRAHQHDACEGLKRDAWRCQRDGGDWTFCACIR